MSPEKQQLLYLINDYLDAVAEAINLLNAKSKREKGFQASFERGGYLDEAETSRYLFHGIGCLVSTPGFEVDFNFSIARRHDAIDPWFLAGFWSHNAAIKAKYPALHHEEQLITLLQELVTDGALLKGLNSFNPDSNNLWLAAPRQPPLPKWKPYPPAKGTEWYRNYTGED